jgi:uncharacterized protein
MEPRLNVITLAVDDLERALVFYRDGLGLDTKGLVATDLVDEKTGAAGAIVIFKLESGLLLTLYPRSELAKDAAVPAGPPQSGEFSLGQLVARRADVDRILEQASASGRSSGTQVAHQIQADAAIATRLTGRCGARPHSVSSANSPTPRTLASGRLEGTLREHHRGHASPLAVTRSWANP